MCTSGREHSSTEADPVIALAGQAFALLNRYEGSGDIRCLHQAVTVGMHCVSALAPLPPPAAGRRRPMALANLASILRTRFEALGDVRDLLDAITLGRLALSAEPADSAEERGIVGNLSLCLRLRGQAEASLDDISEAIVLGERAAELTAPDDPQRAAALSNLGGAFQIRHERSGDIAALDRAIDYGRQALRCQVPAGSIRASLLSNLGSAIQCRAERLGHSQDIAESIELARAAVAETPAEDPGKAARLANLATACLTRFERGGGLADLDEAAASAKAALAVTEAADPRLPGRAANLSAILRTRYQRTGDEPDLVAALADARQAVAVSGAAGAARTASWSNLGTALRARYQAHHEASDALEAETAFQAAAMALTPDDPQRAALLSNLGAILYEHFEQDHDPRLAVRSEAAFRLASEMVTAPPRVRVATSTSWGRIAAERGRYDSAQAGLSLAVHLLGRLVPAELHRTDQQRELRGHFAIAADAAACAIERGDPARALVLLETGRGLLIRQAIDTRADLGPLSARAPELAARLADLRRRLDGLDSLASADSRRHLVTELDQTLALIRQVQGFARFLQPPVIGELLPAGCAGPVVVLNVSELRSDALIVRPGGTSVGSRPLHDVSPRRVHDMVVALLSADALRQEDGSTGALQEAEERMAAVLNWLWHAIAVPVLAELDLLESWSSRSVPTRMWWVPTGLLSYLPLHAAQDEDGTCLLDRVISSSVPTLHALGFARRASSSEAGPKILAVAASSEPGMGALPAAQREAEAVTRLVACPAELLSGAHATRAAVVRAMTSHSWAHFACHATADLLAPSESALMIAGQNTEPLTIADVTKLELAQADVAYLSACTTARSVPELADESVHLTSAFQLAGYRHVIGSLWPVADPIAIRAARLFYTYATQSGALRADRTAAAIRQASLDLRRRYPHRPTCWATYIHVGA